MPGRWTNIQEHDKRKELVELYVKANKTIREIAQELDLVESAVYDRLIRLDIPVRPWIKPRYNNKNPEIMVPKYSVDLAEFIGILLGDGHLTPTQVTVTLGTKEYEYAEYVADLMERLFKVRPKIISSKRGDKVIYLGSTLLVKWLLKMGLVYNKVKSQVSAPQWCLNQRQFIKAFLRGLTDTDGSVYRLSSGRLQISICNCSRPLLESSRIGFLKLGFHPSSISANKIYLTQREDINKYYKEIGFSNIKHQQRF